MKRSTRNTLFATPVVAIAAVLALGGCRSTGLLGPVAQNLPTTSVVQAKAKHQKHTPTFHGPAVRIGNGVARTTFTLDAQGRPASIGIELSKKALEGLPDTPASWVLSFHHKVGPTQYTHMLVDWNPHGHDPVGVYDKPHFDFHFYWIPMAQRLAIGPNDLAQFAKDPAPPYIPPAYLHIPGGVPQMGAHWADLQAPEFTGGTFTRTFIWGSYDGHFIFQEPMITLAYLKGSPNEKIPVRQPQAYERSGWYPTAYSVTSDNPAGKIEVTLDGLRFRHAVIPVAANN